jgi:hypothetical protein
MGFSLGLGLPAGALHRVQIAVELALEVGLDDDAAEFDHRE